MSWPAPDQFSEAVQHPQSAFSDAELRLSSVQTDRIGLPQVCSGAFAAVYRFHCPKRDLAVRCFLSQINDRSERYKHISSFIQKDSLESTVDFRFIEQGIRVNGKWYPILVMDWVNGKNLNSYIGSIVGDTAKLRELAYKFREMVIALEREGLAHGDLQHGNIIISNSQIRLVDYDGCYVPALDGDESHELGHPNYQHPARRRHHFGPYIDRFSAWMIYLSLLSLQFDPQLWEQLEGGDEKLLFGRSDYLKPERSRSLNCLRGHESLQIRQIADMVLDLLETPIEQIPSLETEMYSERQRPLFKSLVRGLSNGVLRLWYKTGFEAPASAAEGSKLIAQNSADSEGESFIAAEEDPLDGETSWYHDSSWQEQAQEYGAISSSSQSSLPASSKKDPPTHSWLPQTSFTQNSEDSSAELANTNGATAETGNSATSANGESLNGPPLLKNTLRSPAAAASPGSGDDLLNSSFTADLAIAPPSAPLVSRPELMTFIQTLPTLEHWKQMPPFEKTIRAAEPRRDYLQAALCIDKVLGAETIKLVADFAAFRCLLGVSESAIWITIFPVKLKWWFSDWSLSSADKRALFDSFVLALNHVSTLSPDSLSNCLWLQGSYFAVLDQILENYNDLQLKSLDIYLYVRLWFRFLFSPLLLENYLLNMVLSNMNKPAARLEAFKAALKVAHSYQLQGKLLESTRLKNRLRHRLDLVAKDENEDQSLWWQMMREAETAHLV